jgi:hypothetical protein
MEKIIDKIIETVGLLIWCGGGWMVLCASNGTSTLRGLSIQITGLVLMWIYRKPFSINFHVGEKND